ncbi:conserved protein of unknown function [Tenacibaculum sp. 190130A14a]|uniref:Tetratricopeptide repeat protein n=1 Tax=Tenacibaculum polynesiense TaxID=3137857 RepID=A0ABM9P7H8_9FLAO
MGLEDDILIERFLRNELSNEESNQFLERLDTDEMFKEQFLLEKQLFESLNEEEWSFIENTNTKEIEEYIELFRSDEANSLKATLSEVNKDFKKEGAGVKSKLFYIAGIAAAVLVILTLNFFSGGNNSGDYYNDYIMLNELPSFTNRGEVSETENLILAEKLFREKKYKEVVESLNKVSNEELKDGNYHVYKAVSLIEIGEYNEAENELDLLINSDLIDAPKGYWYKSLLYIKSKHLDKAKEVLKELVSKSNYKQKEARELLEKLE